MLEPLFETFETAASYLLGPTNQDIAVRMRGLTIKIGDFSFNIMDNGLRRLAKKGGKLSFNSTYDEVQFAVQVARSGDADTVDAFREMGGTFSGKKNFHGVSDNMAMADRGDRDAFKSFRRAEGRFSSEILTPDKKTDAFFLPFRSIRNYLEEGGTFFGPDGKYLIDADGHPSYCRPWDKPGIFKAAIESCLFNIAADAVRHSRTVSPIKHLL